MEDSTFKSLDHQIGDLLSIKCGKEVTTGYKPDLTIIDKAGRPVLIIESEQKTDRKAFLGDYIKAEKYAETCEAFCSLIIVMKEFDNTKVSQIATHLKPYVEWISRLKNNVPNIKKVTVVSDEMYQESVKKRELLTSEKFLNRGIVIHAGKDR